MNKLACCVVPSDPKTGVVGTFSRNVSAGVMHMTEWAFVRRGVSISLGDFAVVQLAVYEFKQDCAFRRGGVEFFVDCTAHLL